MKTERNLFSFEERRLAKLLRQASMASIRREYGRTQGFLRDATELMEWADRPEWEYGMAFLEQWEASVRNEQKGRSLATPPAAWIHLAQELASLLETEGDWVAYLRTRWQLEQDRLSLGRRVSYGLMGVAALVLGVLVVCTIAQSFMAGGISMRSSLFEMSHEQLVALVLTLGRLLGALLMLEHGYYWAKRAALGNSEGPAVHFLPSRDGLILLHDKN